MALMKSAAASLRAALEATAGIAPGAGTWTLLQPNWGGLQGMTPTYESITRQVLSKYMTPEAGDHVGVSIEPKVVHDLNKDSIDLFAPGVFRSLAKHAGNKGQSQYRVSAVTSTGYTVASLGDLTAGLLVYARGFTTAANNGLKVVGASSTGTEIRASGLTVEATPPGNAMIEVVGVQGASADIGISAAGNITATALNLTTLGLVVGEWILIGGDSANAFLATSVYNGYARITAIAAGQITLERRSWTVGVADAGTGKTIQLFFGRFFRNRAIDEAEYLEPSYHMELEQPGVGPAGVTMYRYLGGDYVKAFEIDAPLKSKITTTYSFVGKTNPDPVAVASRVTGPSTAFAPLAPALFDTSTDTKRVRISTASTEGSLVAEINSWKLTIDHGFKPQEIQGVFGMHAPIYGEFVPMLSMEAYYTSSDIPVAIRANTEISFDAFHSNGQAAVLWDLPGCKLRKGDESYPGNDAVMISLDVPAHREMTNNIAASLSVFPYAPARHS